jgi:asparagine synthase (glutamine-hydrolysing)
MCGIAGIIEKRIDKDLLDRMLQKIAHRGPDDVGFWIGKNKNVALGQKRLSIIDLSLGGHQPMISPDGNFVITFNGEIYNYLEIKAELSKLGWNFRSASDTEVLLYSFIQWGEKCLEKINGVFAFAIWDENRQELFAARDRLGEKPFKYYFDGDRLIFASELKAILSYPGISREVDWQAVDIALSLRFVPSPMTGWKNIYKLTAGHYLVWKDGKINIEQYWDADMQIDHSKSYEDWKKEVWELFLDSTRKRMISDVPLGAFLSGGIDSTSVIAAMKEVSNKPVESFVISIGGESEDQKYAASAAKYFGTNHHEIALNNIDYNLALTDLVSHYDEPFFDQSALPGMLISKEMKKHVTVVLSGDGGDELFGGYDAYQFVNFLKYYQYLPKWLKSKVLPKILSFNKNLSYRSEVLAGDFFSAYTEYYSVWKKSLPLSRKYITKEDLYLKDFNQQLNLDFTEKMMIKWFESQSQDMANKAMLADIRGRLADGYLTKTDIATMAHAVELRPPFLDHRLVELSQSMPSRYKIQHGTGKYIWKDIVKDKIPAEIINRRKAGFSIPLHEIIKNELRGVVEDNILSGNCRLAEYFEIKSIKNLWQDHLKGTADYSNHLWSLLILELWLKKYLVK